MPAPAPAGVWRAARGCDRMGAEAWLLDGALGRAGPGASPVPSAIPVGRTQPTLGCSQGAGPGWGGFPTEPGGFMARSNQAGDDRDRGGGGNTCLQGQLIWSQEGGILGMPCGSVHNRLCPPPPFLGLDPGPSLIQSTPAHSGSWQPSRSGDLSRLPPAPAPYSSRDGALIPSRGR